MIAWASSDTTWRGDPQAKLDETVDPEQAAECVDCGDAIHDGTICVECWRDRRELANARDREWWAS